jgi:SAM-dependent methyltransferase
MKLNPAEFWNERYASDEFIYGTQPNEFFKAQLDKIKSGSTLLPAEGEGRNAVYAASQGWQVTAFDSSEEGRNKALFLAKEKQVSINYEVTDVLEFTSDKLFDVIAFSYAHFPDAIRSQANKRLLTFLKPGGVVIFEAFAKAQLGKPSGGPKKIEMLFSTEEIEAEFPDLKFQFLKEETIELSEGKYHKGEAIVIRFIGVKA